MGHGQSSQSSDRSPLVIPESEGGTDDVENGEVKYKFKYYTLPRMRFSTFVRAFLVIDMVLSLALWVSGGDDKYFINSILGFKFTGSVFDLAMLSTVKTIILFPLLTSLEETTNAVIHSPQDAKSQSKKTKIHVAIIMTSVVPFLYALIKGGFMLFAMMHNENYIHMHGTYNALICTSIVFGFVTFVCSLLTFKMMRNLVNIRITHYVNEEGEEVDKSGKVIQKKASLKRLILLAKPEYPMITVATIALFISAGSQTLAPYFFGLVVDAALKSMSDLNKTVLELVGIYFIGAIAGTLRSWLFTLAGQRFVARLRKELFGSIIKQDVSFFDTNRTGELTNRLASDTQVLQNSVTANVSMLSRYMLQIIGSLGFMFVLNPKLTGVLLSVVPIVSISAVQYGRFVQKIRKNFQDRLADASTQAEESLSSIRTVRSFSGEKKSTENYGKDIDKSYDEGKKLALASGGFDGFMGIIAQGAIALVLWYGGKLVYEKELTPGILTSFLLYTFQVAMALAFLSSLYGDFMQAVGASERIFVLLDLKPKVSSEGGVKPDSLNGSVEFSDVEFTYPSRPDTQVLKSVSFSVSKGEMVALVGPSGGGKSTIVNLIERFYDPEKGRILLGGFELKTLETSWFRTKMAMVSQEPTLFACSIKDNIAYGKDATDEEIIEAAKQANAHDFIETFEDKYDTLVGERGVRLSGGQKQRVAIARALIMNPAILLLDEATSALDAESEHLVQEAIDRAMVSRTVLIIAHRLSTVRNASKVVVIDKGAIAESGTHDELIAKDGVYKKLVLRQLTAGQNETTENGKSGLENGEDVITNGKEDEKLINLSDGNTKGASDKDDDLLIS